MINTKTPEGLEERFTQPEGFRFHTFEREGRKIRFGSVFPKESIPDAIVVCLPGLSEPIEKYYETARDFNDKNMAFWVIDWMGQGGSGRYLPNPFKRHSTGFDEDIEDLHYLITEYIKHSSVHPDKGRIPMAMLSHSMGGNIGIQYLDKHKDVFECAGFSAPFMGVPGVSSLPEPILLPLTRAFSQIAGKAYAKGQKDWSPITRPEAPGEGDFSSDPARDSLHQQWLNANPELQIGGVTYRWVYEALKACKKAKKAAGQVETPSLIAIAGDDKIVDNSKIKTTPNSRLLQLEGSKHEILMETDEIRTRFLDNFYDLIRENILEKPETLKPF